ncbi:site-specific DNA-methyltransferase, partial [Sunxiuqinia dokdonensis]
LSVAYPQNFITNVIWEKSDSPRMDANLFSSRHDHILVYAKSIKAFKINRISDGEIPSHYDRVDEEGNPYYLKPLRAMGGEDRREDRPSMFFPIIAPDGTQVYPMRQDGSEGRWRWGLEKIKKEAHRIGWGKSKNGYTAYYRIYHESSKGTPPETIWFNNEVGSNRTSKQEIKKIFQYKAFDTPKPEALVKKVLVVCTDKNDIVLDSFLGSGTTTAVAHKMARHWIGVELGEHAKTHCHPRLKKVIQGEQGGISKSVNWKGGGGFKFYELASSLLNQDSFGNWVMSKEYNPTMVAAAVAKQEGFRYFPDEHIYWKQGKSSEKDFIYTTTQFVTVEILDKIKDEMQPDESLLIACKAFQQECDNRFSNITIKKIPQMLLGRCEFGKDDYSLNIVNMPRDEAFDEESYETDEPEMNETEERKSTQQGIINFFDTDE